MERYCSATALIEQTKLAMHSAPDSIMWQEVNGDIDNVSGRTAFDAMKKDDKTAKEVVIKFIEYQPDVLIIGGGISKEGETLLKPLREIISRESFDKDPKKATRVLAAELGNDAGIIGAAFLGLLAL